MGHICGLCACLLFSLEREHEKHADCEQKITIPARFAAERAGVRAGPRQRGPTRPPRARAGPTTPL